jgi:hypothetical protein
MCVSVSSCSWYIFLLLAFPAHRRRGKQKRQSQALMERRQAGVGVRLLGRHAEIPPPLMTQIWYRYLDSDLWLATLARF